MEEKPANLEGMLTEWILTNGPRRSHREIAQVRETAAQIVRKFFGTLEYSAPVSVRPATCTEAVHSFQRPQAAQRETDSRRPVVNKRVKVL